MQGAEMRASSLPITASRWLTERARRSSRTTTKTSPAWISRNSIASTGRARGARALFLEIRMTARRLQLDQLRVIHLIFS
jgi:hypothetical protein